MQNWESNMCEIHRHGWRNSENTDTIVGGWVNMKRDKNCDYYLHMYNLRYLTHWHIRNVLL